MTERVDKKQQIVWYSVPVSLVQRFMTLGGLLLLIAVSFLIYRQIDTLESRAARVIDEATERTAMLEVREDIRQLRNDHRAAWELLDEARKAYDESKFESALEHGHHCLAVLDSIDRADEGSIRVLSAQGSAEYRRGERGAWKRLRTRVTLNPGDWVKTSTDGSAELLFADGSLFTLRQSTMVHLGSLGAGGDNETTNVAFGKVELNTSDKDRTVTTPRASARVEGDSEALVAFDRDRGAGRFASFSGRLEVRANSTGQTREVAALQQVEQLGERLSEIEALPERPEIVGPADDLALDLASASQVVLDWQPVSNARRYALRISNSRLFAANLIDNTRTKTSARVGLRGEGQFYWQVAALGSGDARGPWSETRSFRVASLAAIGEVNDREPPALDVVSTETYGNIVIVNGKTESGARVTINNETVFLKSDGSFTSTIQMTQAGWTVLEIKSTDAWKNTATEQVRIFIDAL